VLAWAVRLLLPTSRTLSWSTTIVAAVVGAALAWLPLDILVASPGSVARLVVGIAGAVAAVAVTDAVLLARQRRRSRGAPEATVEALIAAGEGERIELKSTGRWNVHTKQRDPRIEDEVVVTVAAFLNAGGGTLLIGVADDGSIVGLDDDYAVTSGHGRDGYELWLREILGTRIGRAETADAGVSFHRVGDGDVCRVDVAPSDRPVFVRSTGGTHAANFHLRVGNATRLLLTDEVLDYSARRWR
jgi:hypothetical protein